MNNGADGINLINTWAVPSEPTLIIPKETLHSNIQPLKKNHLQNLWRRCPKSYTPIIAAVWGVSLLSDNHYNPFKPILRDHLLFPYLFKQ